MFNHINNNTPEQKVSWNKNTTTKGNLIVQVATLAVYIIYSESGCQFILCRTSSHLEEEPHLFLRPHSTLMAKL